MGKKPGNKTRRKSPLTTIAIPKSLCKKIDWIVETGGDGFVSRSDFVRHAIRLVIRDYEEKLEN